MKYIATLSGDRMNIATLFSGIGSPEQGAKRVYGDYNLVFACEWDKFARQSFEANYEIDPQHFHNDINDMDGTQYRGKVDILVGGSPCQDFSIAGLRAGVDGQKGVLIYQYYRLVKEVQPEIIIYENVDGMMDKKHIKSSMEFIWSLSDLGYHIKYEILNTKDYGVPQNRERIFLVGFKNVDHYYSFSFAPKIQLDKRLKDVLEHDVDDKYYLSDKMIDGFKRKKNKNYKFEPHTRDDEYSKCLVSSYHKSAITNPYIMEPNCTPIGMLDMGGFESTKRVYSTDGLSPTLKTGTNNSPKIIQRARGYNNGGLFDICPTITTNSWQDNNHLDEGYRIRRLTPRECFSLQDFPDDFKFVVSNSQLYKQAGNSISVNMMEMIFEQIELSRHSKQQHTLF